MSQFLNSNGWEQFYCFISPVYRVISLYNQLFTASIDTRSEDNSIMFCFFLLKQRSAFYCSVFKKEFSPKLRPEEKRYTKWRNIIYIKLVTSNLTYLLWKEAHILPRKKTNMAASRQIVSKARRPLTMVPLILWSSRTTPCFTATALSSQRSDSSKGIGIGINLSQWRYIINMPVEMNRIRSIQLKAYFSLKYTCMKW